MMDDFIGTYGDRLILAVVGVGVALLLLAIVLWFVRRRSGSAPFIRGGKNRQPRLQVLDATAVDARRRLVLVRRDNVEHLVMIGGPTDIVIESGIGAIPILRDVNEPQQALTQATADRAITEERPVVLSRPKEDEVRVTPASSSTQNAAQAERKQPIIPSRPLSVVPARQQEISTQATSEPDRPAAPKPIGNQDAPSAPRALAREPVSPMPNSAISAIPAPSVEISPPRPAITSSPEQSESARKPLTQPTAIREPVMTENDAADYLDAARRRVLPTASTASPTPPPAQPKKEPLAPGESGEVFGDQLTSDFESFLEAEIAKNKAAETANTAMEDQQAKRPSLEDTDRDQAVQKEMARIFGEMSVTRDR